jgi:hypothetical protein
MATGIEDIEDAIDQMRQFNDMPPASRGVTHKRNTIGRQVDLQLAVFCPRASVAATNG